jgi:nucleotide-binding universal stress UspA family protein
VRAAAAAAVAAGAGEVDQVAVVGSPVETLIDVVTRAQADLLVVGNRGLNSLRGRLMGSVPADVTRRSAVDVLVVHTTG